MQKYFYSEYLPKICLQTANGDFDFLNDKNMCSACWRCSLLTMEGGALTFKEKQTKKNRAHMFSKEA